jgi:hypothetical protein
MRPVCSSIILILTIFAICLGQDKSGKNTKLPQKLLLDRNTSEKPFDFIAEEITLIVSETSSTVNGVYHFKNNTDKIATFPIVFPFYIDSLTQYPDSIRAFIIVDGDTLNLLQKELPSKDGISLRIPMPDGKLTAWYLNYTQKISGPEARYILTSTTAWGKPLENATYTFWVPESFNSVTVWPEADSVITESPFKKYISHKSNFMPTADMQVRWKPK